MQYDSLDKNKIAHFYCELSLWEERQEGGGIDPSVPWDWLTLCESFGHIPINCL